MNLGTAEYIVWKLLGKKNLDSLIAGVKEGRNTFANTLKYVFMATSANFGNMFSMADASLFLPFLPLLPGKAGFKDHLMPWPIEHRSIKFSEPSGNA